jgi:hypothetical protein
MKECKNPLCSSTEVLYSGIDAVVLQVEPEAWCYKCANAIAKARELEEVR